ncbi:hypothetical protein [Reyranella sp.]|uniref:hypothetical protein n=1 Tax=Reyranella sp. TaxID=1929291 RepID=UPI00272FEE9A|nr:hypothetical protein [Reyranella sp.]MDP2377779.1 hypothetical protein [Reyranella sp.]
MSDASDTQNAKVGIEQGGERGFVKSGGAIDFEAGTGLKIAGVDVAPAIARQHSSRIVTLVESGAITEALHKGKTCLLAEVGGDAAVELVLPAATGSGGKYRFVVDVVNTSGYVIKAAVGADVFRGLIFGQSATDSATDAARTWKSGSTDDTLTFNGTTKGGVQRGDWVEFEDVAADAWAVRGMITQSGAEASPFSDSVT